MILSLVRRFAAVALLLGALPMTTPTLLAQTPSAAAAKATAATATGDKVDINSASADQLKAIPGIGDAYAKRIIAGRPYSNKAQLTSKGVLPQGVYDKVKDRMVATQAKK